MMYQKKHKYGGEEVYTLYGKLRKKESFASVYQRFCSQIQSNSVKCEFFHWYLSRILLIDSGLPNLNMDFFPGIFQEFSC